MLAIGSLPYPIAAILSHKARNAPRKPTIQSSIEASSSPYKLTKRKNYLRPKILRTLRKPHLIPLSPPTPEDPITPIEPNEPNLMVPSEPTSEKSHSSFVEEFETPFDSNDSGPSQLQVVQRTEAPPYVVGFKGFSSRTIFRIVASFVGLFVLQTVVSVWMMGSSYSDEKDRNMGVGGRHRALRLGTRKTEVGLNGNAFPNVDESEMEKKIVEIRQLAREVRNIDNKKSLENTEADDVSDDDDDDGLESDSSKLKSGIVKEVDGRLTKLRKTSPTPLLNVNFLNKIGDLGKEGEVEGSNGKEEDNMLMFEMKHKFRSHLTTPRDKPKGFQSPEHGTSVREKHRNMDDDDQTVGRNGKASGNGTNSSNDNREINGLASRFPERSNVDSQKDDKKPISRNSSPLEASNESSGSNSATKKLNKGFGGSTPSQASKKTSGSNSAAKKSNKGKNEGAKPKRGVVQDSNSGNPLDEGVNSKDSSIIATQDSRKKINDRNISTASKTLAKSRRKVQPDTEKLGRKSSMSVDKDLNGDPDPWWLTLPYVFVILMQKGPDSEGQQGFFKIRISSDAGSQSYTSYMVGFEDRGDARNFSYLLESEFEDLPNATIDVVPFPVKELKEVVKSVNNKVIVVKKGELQLYAGQPLSEVESALISLVK